MTIKLTIGEAQELLYASQIMFDKLINSNPDRAEKYSAIHDKLFDAWETQDE